MKIFVVLICAIISDIKAQNTIRAHQNVQPIPGWQNRNYQAKPNYNKQYMARRSHYEPPATNLNPPIAPKERIVPGMTVPTESYSQNQPNYGFVHQPLSPSSKATILKQEYERLPDGGYRFLYETSDGQSREEIGFFRQHPQLGKILTVHGSYGYIAPNNKKIFVKYTADERGYRQEMLNHPPSLLPSNVINSQLGFLKI